MASCEEMFGDLRFIFMLLLMLTGDWKGLDAKAGGRFILFAFIMSILKWVAEHKISICDALLAR